MNSGFRRGWLVAANRWPWTDFFERPRLMQWGGPKWIKSTTSMSRIREMRQHDLIVCYQAGQGVVGLARLASDGYSSDGSKNTDSFDVAASPAVLLQAAVPLRLVKGLPDAAKEIEFVRFHQGTVFEVTPRGIVLMIDLLRTENSQQKAEIESLAFST